MPTSQWGREHPDEIDNPEGAGHVSLSEAHEHGYWGVSQDPTPREDYTVEGVTGGGGTASSNAPQSSARHSARSSTGGGSKDAEK